MTFISFPALVVVRSGGTLIMQLSSSHEKPKGVSLLTSVINENLRAFARNIGKRFVRDSRLIGSIRKVAAKNES